jgi:phosphatidylserine decarboxylase
MNALREKADARINNTLPVAKEGLPFMFSGTGLTLFLIWIGLSPLGVISGLMTLFIIYFFRDPERACGADKNEVLTPADGRVLDVLSLPDADNPLAAPAVKVSVFMSVFDVHVNRIPLDGKISRIIYHRGKFFSANLDKASEQNENNRITLQTDDGRKIVFVQVAGLIARRIACWVREGERVKAGQRFGLIRFGSRLDVYLPADSRIITRPRDKVKAGQTIIGYLS